MPAPPKVPQTRLYGRNNLGLVTAVADRNAPTVAELTAATGLDITDLTFNDNTTFPEAETSFAEAPKMWGDTTVFQFVADTNYGSGTLTYNDTPQAFGVNDNKLRALIPEFAIRTLWQRPGKPKVDDLAADDVVHLWLVEFGPSTPTTVGEGASAVAAARAPFTVRAVPSYWRKVVA